MTDRWKDRLSQYLDGELPPLETRRLERHLAKCPDCSAALGELREVVSRAATLEPSEPPVDLWPLIAARIREAPGSHEDFPPEVGHHPGTATARPGGEPASLAEERARRAARRPGFRRFTVSLPQLAAAAIALVLLSGGAVWLALGGLGRGGGASAGGPGLPGPAGPSLVASGSPTWPAGGGLARYEAAIAELEELLFWGEARLDTATVRKLRQSLATIDRAIADARQALEADPANTYVHQHLAETMRRKVDLLRTTAFLVAES